MKIFRGEKPEQLDDNLTKLEQRIENIKQVCQAVGKKLLACLQLHGVDLEKRPVSTEPCTPPPLSIPKCLDLSLPYTRVMR